MDNQVKILKSVELDFGVAELRNDNILTFDPNKNINTYNLKQLKEMLIVFKDITNGTPLPYYSDNSKLSGSIGSDEKVFMSAHFHEFATAFAMKENSALTRFVAHTFIYLNKPQIPIKMFKTKSDAINWLKS
ncbi:hypothetical protein N9242_08025 [Vicingaceae bacterium]|jgi:hypothetical protein|nr:hypothetical protein [Vicingaceae bacterium]